VWPFRIFSFWQAHDARRSTGLPRDVAQGVTPRIKLEQISLGSSRKGSQYLIKERGSRHFFFGAKPYSVDLRARVIEEVETGVSRREAAERYGISPSVVVIWVQRFEETGSVAAKPSGGSTSPLKQHAEFLLGCQPAGADAGRDPRGDAQTPDRWQSQRGVAVLRSPQHQLKKNSVFGGAEACGRSPRSPAVDARARHV
jgi:transposase